LPETQGSKTLPGVLASIVQTKRAELSGLASRKQALEAAIATAPRIQGFARALSAPGRVALIAECKRRSPGAGAIRPDLDPVRLTRSYEEAGAAALSVLTDATYFGGSNDDLVAIRAAASIPVLRKDFTLDLLHVLEARAIGADAVLLIVRILSDSELRTLHGEAVALGMDVLVETHDAQEVRRALDLGARVIGINNRDLSTFTTDLDTTLRLLEQIPHDVVVVSESGIRSASDVAVLGAQGVDAVLVGETLLRAHDPAAEASSMARIACVARHSV
jgi:indole-3-glycerol phosphate synthase